MAERALNQRVIYGAEWEREGFSGLLFFWLRWGNSAASPTPKSGNKPDPSVTLPASPHPRSLPGAGVERQRLEHL